MRSLTRDQAAFLKNLFPGEDCLLEPEQTLVFGADASREFAQPLAVVRPTERRQIAAFMAWAHQERMPVYTRARGTNMAGGCIPDQHGVVLSTLKLNHILEINREDFIAVTEPGVVTSDLQAAVEAQNMFYPPDPASQNISTIGGNVAMCAGGMRAVKYGVTRDFVLGLTAVLPGGEEVSFGGRTHKNVVGLDLTRLFVGSEGTLGVITDITLKLLPRPEATASLLACYATAKAALDAAARVLDQGLLPTAMEFMNPTVMRCLAMHRDLPWPPETQAALLFMVDGSAQAVRADLAGLKAVVKNTGPVYTASGAGPEAETPLWDIRRAVSPAGFQLGPHKLSDDVTLPRSKAGEAAAFIEKLEQQLHLAITVFGHLGDGNLHVNIMYDAEKPEQAQRASQAKEELLHKVIELRGSMSGEHGVGCAKAKYLDLQLSPAERRLMAQVKAVFDPHNIMNPGKAY